MVATVATQATVYGVIGLVIGIPLGLVVGRLVWNAVANDAGLAGAPLPVLLIAGVVGASLIVVNVIGLLPCAQGAPRPAVVLRSE